MFRALAPVYKQEVPAKGARQWGAAYLVALAFVMYWAFLAFVFEAFTPSVPDGYRKITLPLIVCLLTVLVLTRTKPRLIFDRVRS